MLFCEEEHMKKGKELLNYFTKGELALWMGSVAAILVSFLLFSQDGLLTLLASLVGVTSLIFCAKGNPFGQMLMILFSLLYGIISYTFSYYGEMITYLGMTMPMAAAALVSWTKNPYEGNRNEVEVNELSGAQWRLMWVLGVPVTIGFYFVLNYFGTANIGLSTLSVLTSFIAVYLTFCRSAYFALGYAANDVVLIGLWIMAAWSEPQYWSVAVCFIAFFVNDIYGFLNWRRMWRRQTLREAHS